MEGYSPNNFVPRKSGKLARSKDLDALSRMISGLRPMLQVGSIPSLRGISGPVLLKITGDAFTGGRYKALKAEGVATASNDSSVELTIPEPNVVFPGLTEVYADNLPEDGLNVHMLPSNGSVCALGWFSGHVNITDDEVRELYNIDLVPPSVLACLNTASAGDPPLYTLRRVGDPTGPPVGTGLTPWRPISIGGFTGTNLSGLLTPATLTHWMPNGTGVAMTFSNEQFGNHPCGTNTPYY